MTKGSVLFYTGSIYHGGGANRSNNIRTGINITYNVSWLRQEENQYLSVPLEIARTLPVDLLRLMGYRLGAYALGYVDDTRDPIEVVRPDLARNGFRPVPGNPGVRELPEASAARLRREVERGTYPNLPLSEGRSPRADRSAAGEVQRPHHHNVEIIWSPFLAIRSPDELLYSSPQLITSGAKRFDTHNSGCFQLGRIRHAPVQFALRAIEPRTGGSRHIADGDDVVKVLTDEFLNRF